MATVEYYDSLIKRVDGVKDCSELIELNVEIESIFTESLASITDSLAKLLPLLTVPGADLGEIVDWITAVVATYSGPSTKLLALQAATITKQAEAVAAVQSKSSELGCSI